MKHGLCCSCYRATACVIGLLLHVIALVCCFFVALLAAKLTLSLQDSRKLLQIDDSATTVNAAPLSAANATANATSSLLSSPSEDSKPHSILSDVISSFKAKYGKHDGAPSAAPESAPPASATANATASSSDDGDDDEEYYMDPCTSAPVPTAYEAFVEVSYCCKL